MLPEPDIVAVGFQEIVPLSASNVVLGKGTCLLVLCTLYLQSILVNKIKILLAYSVSM